MQGSAFKEQILTVMDANSFFNSKMLPYNDTDEGGTLYTTFYKTVESTFPRYLDEIQGMADGSNLSFSMVSTPSCLHLLFHYLTIFYVVRWFNLCMYVLVYVLVYVYVHVYM